MENGRGVCVCFGESEEVGSESKKLNPRGKMIRRKTEEDTSE